MKFRGEDKFDVESFRIATQIAITAQEIIVDNASYPTEQIEVNSRNFRPLGLGYANLGALLMSSGLPYDSDEGRAYAAIITAIMHGEAYRQSALIAKHKGAFYGFKDNRNSMLRVINKHRDAVGDINHDLVPDHMTESANEIWDEVVGLGESYGFRNSQVTVLAPTGTIGFMMDCDTTGIEPDLALTKYKKLVGGGVLKIINTSIPLALRKLGYSPSDVTTIVAHIDKHGTIEGTPVLKEEHLPVFDCALKAENGNRSIHFMGHVKMMAAAQPFLSGAISKTINMPNDATVDDVQDVYFEAWRTGLKAVAIYRDGSKKTQPMNAGKNKESKPAAARKRLSRDRTAAIHKFTVAGHEGYVMVGMYDDGTPGEIFIKMAKEGSTISGLMDSFATSISIAMQYGVPLSVFCKKFKHLRFEPSGWTDNPDMPICQSIMDYIFTWLSTRFLENKQPEQLQDKQDVKAISGATTDAPLCQECGNIMTRNGSCHKCENCGSTSGCS